MVTRAANGEIAVQLVKGPTSFYSSNDPLFLVDQVPYKPGPNGTLVGINPYDIESIEALTKPEETTMYGVRASNGVIVITLKKPGKA
jgi:TonB-dependent starch-binding outer membrane protein SusC